MSEHMKIESMKIEQWPIEKVTPYENNPRVIGDNAVAKVRESIERYGWQQPIVVDPEGVVVVGHTRLRAAQEMGLKQVPVHVTDLPAEKIDAYRLVDNRTGEMGKWDTDALALELREFGDDLVETYFPNVDLEISSIEDTHKEFSEEDLASAVKSVASVTPASVMNTHLTKVECPACAREFQVRTSSLPGVNEEMLKAMTNGGAE